MRIYRITPNRKSYQGLYTDDESELLKYDLFAGKPLPDKQLTLKLDFDTEGDEKSLPRPDYPSLISYIPVFSRKAVAVLDPELSRCGDLVPINNDGEYYAFNVVNVQSLLDFDRSVVKRYPSTNNIMDISKYVFKATNIHEDRLFIFKLDGFPTLDVFVNHNFKAKAESNMLTGMDFLEIGDIAEFTDRV